MSQLLQQRTTQKDFRLPLNFTEAYQLLYAAYAAEVKRRGKRLQADNETTRVVSECAQYLSQQDAKLTGMLFCGTCGNGKTTLLLAIQNAVNWLSEHGLFQNEMVTEQLNEVRIISAKDISKNYKRDSERIKAIPVLGIEDMGNEPTEAMEYGNVSTPIIDLIEHRYNKQLFTFITTNLTGSEIREKYDERVADRLNEMCKIIIFKGSSYR